MITAIDNWKAKFTFRPGLLRRLAVHGLRVGLFVAIIVLIRVQHRDYLAAQNNQGLPSPPLERVQRFLPAAVKLEDGSDNNGRRAVLDESGTRLGFTLQTAPQSYSIIGFSGPSNLLIVFDLGGRILGLDVLWSRDTREHSKQVIDDPNFLRSFNGLTWEEAAGRGRVDAVTGATLTSLAMAEGVQRRLGGKPGSLKFPEPITLKDLKPLFPQADHLEFDPGDPAVIRVQGREGLSLGWVLRSSPAADNTIGYQGPTDGLIGFDPQGKILGLVLGKSFDNEPYVRYVREDEDFRTLFSGKTLGELAGFDLKVAEVEGVTGATMTSMAVARGIVLAAQQKLAADRQPSSPAISWGNYAAGDVGTILVIGTGILIGFTNLRGLTWVRVTFQLIVFGYLGLVNGALLSQAQLVGWAQAGLPRGAIGLVLLTTAALLLPITTKRNLYCTHLCPHGALQQLALRWARPRFTLPPRWRTVFLLIPGSLLVVSLMVAMTHRTFHLVDIEPFDAYVFRVAGWATLTIAVVSALVSLRVPMAYCRHACPTGALLEHLRRHSRSERITLGDVFALSCFLVAAGWWVCG